MPESKDLDSSKQKDSVNVEKYSTFENFDENTHRVRRNLLIFSVIALFYKLSGATLGNESSFFGLKFEDVDTVWVDRFLLLIVIYHLIHFLWLAYEHFQHNIISLTRVGKKDVRGNNGWNGNGEITLKDDTWNLYFWMKKIDAKEHPLFKKNNKIYEISNQFTELKNLILQHEGSERNVYIETNLEAIRQNLNLIIQRNEAIDETIAKPLKKFDKYFKNYSLTNKLRWGIIEFGIPFLLGCFAIYLF